MHLRRRCGHVHRIERCKTHATTPSSRRRVDGVRSGAKFDFHTIADAVPLSKEVSARAMVFTVGATAGSAASDSRAGFVYMYMDPHIHNNNTLTKAIGKSRNKECDRAAARDLAYAMAHARELAGVQELGRARSVG